MSLLTTIKATFLVTSIILCVPAESSPASLPNDDTIFEDTILPENEEAPENGTFRVVLTGTRRLWPNGIVPYLIDPFNPSPVNTVLLIQSAFREYQSNTCVRFVHRTTQENYVRFTYGDGCYSSHVGFANVGEQIVSIGDGCLNPGIILHNLGHVLGFYDEQQRTDRNTYVVINFDNIIPGKESEYQMVKASENFLINTFDYDSIMLLGGEENSKGLGLKTMVAKNGQSLPPVSEKFALSERDIYLINRQYACQSSITSLWQG